MEQAAGRSEKVVCFERAWYFEELLFDEVKMPFQFFAEYLAAVAVTAWSVAVAELVVAVEPTAAWLAVELVAAVEPAAA